MRIIVLKGDQNVGKSTVLNAVYNELTFFNGVVSTPKQKDFECIITLKDKKRVAFFTMGDYITEIENAIERYSYLDCEVLIIAFNNEHHNSLHKIETLYPHNIVEKSLPYKTDSSKWRDVGNVLSLI